jgi:hypothetical protein
MLHYLRSLLGLILVVIVALALYLRRYTYNLIINALVLISISLGTKLFSVRLVVVL